MIELKNVKFYYQKNNIVFSNLNYTFEKGNIYFLTGENGVGKTTIAKLILGILNPISGSIDKKDINQTGYLPDFNGLYPQLTVLENIKYRMALYNQNYQEHKDMVESALCQYKIYKYLNTDVLSLSLGTEKKVAILCVAMIPCELLILDEPTGGLDKSSRLEALKMVVELRNENRIVLCITHDQDLLRSGKGIILSMKDENIYEI